MCSLCTAVLSPQKESGSTQAIQSAFLRFLVSVYFFYAAAEAEAYSSTLHLIK